MLNLIQHLTKSRTYETLKQVQGDKLGFFTRPSNMNLKNEGEVDASGLGEVLWPDFHIYGILSIVSVPYLIWYSLILERRVL
jgi:hypothetical protein